MSEPIQFKQFNKTLDAPRKLRPEDENGGGLPIHTDGFVCLSCWRMTWRERLSALIFGRVWLYVSSGSTQPPVSIEVKRTPYR